jgi:tRNA pseudouridine55 synthase
MAKRARNCRPVSGIVLLDKPVGMSSNAALQTVKRLYGACKAGHTGSLDPLASGLLPICLGDAAKVSQFLLDADKRYEALIALGSSTTTYDAEGEVVESRPVTVSDEALRQALAGFVGWIDQVPPMFSALKQHGQPLYKQARRGITVERASRRVHISELRLLEYAVERVRIEVACSKGTYIRSLAHDLGEVLGCGAHLAGLRRVATAMFSLEDAATLSALEAMTPAAREALLLPADSALPTMPAVRLAPDEVRAICCGRSTAVAEVLRPGWVRLYEGDARFLGMGQVLPDGRVAPKRLVSLEPAPTCDSEQVEDGVRGG